MRLILLGEISTEGLDEDVGAPHRERLPVTVLIRPGLIRATRERGGDDRAVDVGDPTPDAQLAAPLVPSEGKLTAPIPRVRLITRHRSPVLRGCAQRGGGPARGLVGPGRVGLGRRDLHDRFELLAGEPTLERNRSDLGPVGQRPCRLDERAGSLPGDASGPAHPADGVQRAVVPPDLPLVEDRQHEEPVRAGGVVERVQLPEGGLELRRRRVPQAGKQRLGIEGFGRIHAGFAVWGVEHMFVS